MKNSIKLLLIATLITSNATAVTPEGTLVGAGKDQREQIRDLRAELESLQQALQIAKRQKVGAPCVKKSLWLRVKETTYSAKDKTVKALTGRRAMCAYAIAATAAYAYHTAKRALVTSVDYAEEDADGYEHAKALITQMGAIIGQDAAFLSTLPKATYDAILCLAERFHNHNRAIRECISKKMDEASSSNDFDATYNNFETAWEWCRAKIGRSAWDDTSVCQ